jgi:hypothetical protein
LNLCLAYSFRYLNNIEKAYNTFSLILEKYSSNNIPSLLGVLDISFERNHLQIAEEFTDSMMEGREEGCDLQFMTDTLMKEAEDGQEKKRK